MRPPTSLLPVLVTALAVSIPAAPLPVSAVPLRPAALPSAPTSIPDFDGDGAPDLAIGNVEDRRTVRVRYATGRVQDIARSQLDGSDLFTDFGSAILARDLNRDGYADLVVGDPGDRGTEGSPAAFIVFGSAGGLEPTTPHRIPRPEGLAGFGTALALVEGATPLLVVGAPGDNAARADGGTVATYALGGNGLPLGGPALLSQDSARVPGRGEAGDGFGWSLAATGSLLLVGAPWESVGRARHAGAVTVFSRRADGSLGAMALTQATRGVPGSPETEDWFGMAVAAGDGYAVVGVPGEDGGRYGSAGRVQPFGISAGSLRPLPAVDQSTRGVPGTREPDDHFGAAVAMARPCPGAVGFLAGAPGEDVAGNEFAGAAWSIPLTRTSTCRARSFYRGHGLPAGVSDFEQVGDAVAVLPTSGPAAADALVIAGPGSEDGPSGSVYLVAGAGGPATTAFAHLYSPFGISLTP